MIACLSQTPPELAQDLILNGVHLVGGGGMLRGLDRRLSEETDLPVHLVDAPLECVVLGAGRCLENFDSLKEMFMAQLRRALLTAIRGDTGRGTGALAVDAQEVLGGLADLPVGVFDCQSATASAASTVGAVERGEREDRAAADRGLVGAAGEHRGKPGGIAERAERGDRRFAHERVVVLGRGRE